MKNLLLLIGLLVCFSSCRKDIDTTGMKEVVEQPPLIIDEYDPVEEIITSSVSGLVINENNEAIPNAIIKLGSETYTTDEEGYFFAKNKQLNAQGTFFTVTKDGYFKGSRRFYPKEGTISNTRVQLMALNDIGQFPSADGATVTGSDGISITFPANGIMNDDGMPYDGTVTVAAKWLNPSSNNVGDLMPGSLFGVNQLIEEVSLETYGMMAVELFGENGEALNIADGKTAELSFPVPADLIAGAPDEIPLWSFEDDQYGVWVEEGKAVLTGDKYVGTVSHFSFWNCDAPFPLVVIEGRLVTASGEPIPNASVKVSIIGGGGCSYGSTDSEGYFSGKMPKGRILAITMGSWNAPCEFASTEVGPFDVDTDVGDISLLDAGDAFTVSGTVVDCLGAPVTEGRAKITVGNSFISVYTESDGTFSTEVLNCENETEFYIKGDDLVNLVGSDVSTFTIAPSVDVGTIAACGNVITEFITLTVNGETQNYAEANLWFELPSTGSFMGLSIPADSTGNPNLFDTFSITLQSGAEGTYTTTDLSYLSFNVGPPSFTNVLTLNCQGACAELTALTVNITLYEGIGGNQEGNLTGTANFTDDMGAVVPDVPFSASWRLPIN